MGIQTNIVNCWLMQQQQHKTASSDCLNLNTLTNKLTVPFTKQFVVAFGC